MSEREHANRTCNISSVAFLRAVIWQLNLHDVKEDPKTIKYSDTLLMQNVLIPSGSLYKTFTGFASDTTST